MFSRQIHEKIYFYTLIFLAISIPLSIFTTTIAQMILALNWIAELRFKEKWQRFKEDKALWLFMALIGLHILGLLWTSDLAYGIKDIKIKMPLLALPLIMGTSVALIRKQVDLLLHFFVLAVFVATLASIMALTGLLAVEVIDYRDISLFISYIRFALLIVFAIAIIVYFLFFSGDKLNVYLKSFYMISLIWLPFFLVVLKSMSGIVIFIILLYFLLLKITFRIRDSVIRFMVFVITLIIPLLSVAYIGYAIKRFNTVDIVTPADVDEKTIEGNAYLNLVERKEIENGHYVWLHVCQVEMEREWNRISEIDYKAYTENGNLLEPTLIRYLTSRGLRKDAVGISQLDENDIKAIESGIANHIYLKRFALYPRIYEIIWEINRYRLGYSPNEKSMVMRLLYLDAGWNIAKDNLWYGVGTGDTPSEFEAYYESVNSPLEGEWRRRAHNQYLTFIMVFGLPGFILCMISILVPVFMKRRWNSYMLIVFFLIMGLSMLNEDTIETSAGVTPFALFYMLFVFGPAYKWLKNE